MRPDPAGVERPPPSLFTGWNASTSLLNIHDASKPVATRLAEVLASKAARVIDLFREWDTNNDGELSRAEFYQGIARPLGERGLLLAPQPGCPAFSDRSAGRLYARERRARAAQISTISTISDAVVPVPAVSACHGA